MSDVAPLEREMTHKELKEAHKELYWAMRELGADIADLRAENQRLREAMDPRLLRALRAAVGYLRDINRPNTADVLDELRVILAGGR